MIQNNTEDVNAHNTDDENQFFVNYIDICEENSFDDDVKLEWLVNLKVNNNFIKFKIDSGAQVNCISEKLYNNLVPKPSIIKRNVTLRSYDKKVIPSLGMCIAKLLVDNVSYNTLFAVVKNSNQPIIGLGSSLRFGFIKVPTREDGSSSSQELSLDVQAITTHTLSNQDSQSDSSFASTIKAKY